MPLLIALYHFLTIYNCIVLSLRIAPGKVEDLKITTASPTELKISRDKSPDEKCPTERLLYEVQYSAVPQDECAHPTDATGHTVTNESDFLIENLQPFTNYDVSVAVLVRINTTDFLTSDWKNKSRSMKTNDRSKLIYPVHNSTIWDRYLFLT